MPTTTPVRGLIFNEVVTALTAISIAAGDHVTVIRVYRNHESSNRKYEEPSLSVMDRGDSHVRLAAFYEARIQMDVMANLKEFDKDERRTVLDQLRSDAEVALKTGDDWSEYAVETNVQSADTQVSDATNPQGISLLRTEVLYRTQLNNPYVVWIE